MRIIRTQRLALRRWRRRADRVRRLGMATTVTATRLALLALLALACGTDEGSPIARLPLAHSFHMTVSPTFAPSARNPLPGRLLAFQLRLDDQGATTAALVSTHHKVIPADFRDVASGRLVLTHPVDVSLRVEDDRCAHFELTRYEEMTLITVDDDGDGQVDRLVGSARGVAHFFAGTALVREPFSATLEGSLDIMPPSLSRRARGLHHVLDPLTLHASEPLAPSTTARLRAAGGEVIELIPCCTDAAPTLFRTPEGLILPHDTTLTVELEPGLRDLAGNDAPLDLAVTTVPDPGDLIDPGFDSRVDAITTGTVYAFTGVNAITPIAGSRSLLIEADGRATMRLPIPPGASRLSLSVRGLARYQKIGFAAEAVLRAAGTQPTAIDVGTWLDVLGSPFVEAESGPQLYGSRVLVMDAALPDGTQDEVYLDIHVERPYSCPRLHDPDLYGALLVDEVRLE